MSEPYSTRDSFEDIEVALPGGATARVRAADRMATVRASRLIANLPVYLDALQQMLSTYGPRTLADWEGWGPGELAAAEAAVNALRIGEMFGHRQPVLLDANRMPVYPGDVLTWNAGAPGVEVPDMTGVVAWDEAERRYVVQVEGEGAWRVTAPVENYSAVVTSRADAEVSHA